MLDARQPKRLQSYLCGAWRDGRGAYKPLLDAATGAVVAEIDATGLDMAEALDHGRRAGARLRAMTVHERALMLKAVGLALLEQKDDFHALSLATGATPKDGWIDIDGGIGTLLNYASKARRDLPNTRVLTDGAVESLSQDHSFSARHILTPLRGVAVHINAFNFPVWGMLEKLAPNLLAGMPAIVKPASQTAYLTELVVRRILATGLLPEGTLQLVCGSIGDLLDHVTGQDVVTFTGSAATGQMLKAHPAIIGNSTRFTMEADSLNACILGPDAAPGSPEFDLFIREVMRETTAKAGQKCTAIRRVLVPRAAAGAVRDALAARMAKVVVGLPGDTSTQMGALASLAQRDDVRAAIARLQAGAEIIAGTPDTVRVTSGDAERGAFLNPVLLYADDLLGAKAVHEVEAFGPVATLLPYDDPAQAVEIAALGKGSLVSSLFTNAPEVAEEIVLGLAPFHGRVMIGNRDSAKSSTGHGSPLPMLVHGGPGRAGGGEELGGMRGLHHYMQRSAVQGTPRLLTAVTGEWMQGAETRADTHPFRKSLAELRLGDQIVTARREITLADIEHFAAFTGDTFYAHMDEDAARANPFFDGRVAHGYLIVSFAAGLFVQPDPGPVLANYGIDNLRFLTPVYPGDTLGVVLTCKAINPRADGAYGEVRWDCEVSKQDGSLVAQYDVLTMVAMDWAG
ncbi:MAG: bifunctional oxepin-CoA hydrolase / NADP-dependent 3-oxo-5,6-dehydrosuberyl-CoA semialdehyde dehydro [Roseibaca calidilacus]|uniref:Bifunctional oxepin-CoA hydrolase / NADP-dependent 3-oxo-5,6-dehydrosuberyl-CoA semialdehyde dehydro n=1 Tax=Roseibaca calidilacus TaxID=1666912 RepID=A0A0P8A984_9RHOB|nr:phenylacetic acid degradation bifunctional protein PaaZ [Roseibaca calidilacus]KPP90718.1 MAG: bifunctional oxepin-CoA hydrolase / NADP-dependent 3-oxo-5,6-dehydrosuberyl-CoA semialdehyde dehydro [Roseibaca calidilacus]CUX83442.1 oxepin-CoA hydrolase / 3-oxo-5,6-dehydrosuberyl-CoA semialdehyde dehydrogenase [Roseibaca calidilacus]